MKYLELKIHSVNNEAIENLYYYKYFFLELAPFDLNLDGNFCDEIYKYALDIFSHTKKHSRSQQSINIYEEPGEEIEKMKQAFKELKKPYEREQ